MVCHSLDPNQLIAFCLGHYIFFCTIYSTVVVSSV
uniref:Uncharacterized protein n=1 Tax=Rhizophora mucronata TaxID=61149 RepID=A0A2P2N8S8_RHIMU